MSDSIFSKIEEVKRELAEEYGADNIQVDDDRFDLVWNEVHGDSLDEFVDRYRQIEEDYPEAVINGNISGSSFVITANNIGGNTNV